MTRTLLAAVAKVNSVSPKNIYELKTDLSLTPESQTKQLHVYLTKSSAEYAQQLRAANVPVTEIEDLAIGHVMKKVDQFGFYFFFISCYLLNKTLGVNL